MDIGELINRCIGYGWRCLLVVIGDNSLDLGFINDNLCISKYAIGDVFIRYNIKCDKIVNFSDAHKLLGMEYRNVYLSLKKTRGWPGNLLALSMEYVSYGGIYGLFVPKKLLETRFGKYFLEQIINSRNHIVIENNKIKHYNIIREKPSKPKPPDKTASDKIIRKLISLAVTNDQGRALKILPSFLYSPKYKLLLVHGDRGRGKSGLLGLYLAYILYRGRGKYYVTSRRLENVQSLFRILIKALNTLGLNYNVIRDDELIRGIMSSNGKIVYATPWRIPREINKPLIVDEAASVGIARIRRWYNGIGKLIVSSTIHGYEGSGRVLLKYINEYFKRTIIVKLKTPIRYYPNDPLEKTMYRIFHLDAEPEDIGSNQVFGARFREYNIEDLSENYELLRKIYGLLVIAHYRNEPDDLVLLLDTGYFRVFGLEDEHGRVIGVAQIRSEEYDGLNSLGKSTLLLNILYRYGLLGGISNLRIARIVRIAVMPSLQRKGYGSKLLRFLEDKYSSEKYDSIGAIFSGFETIFFWLKNKYYPIYVSPRYNKAIGEKNIVVLKPFNKDAEDLVFKASSILLQRLYYASHILYRDLGVEKLLGILDFLKRSNIELPNKDLDCTRLNQYLSSRHEYCELIIDILYKYFNELDLLGIDNVSKQIVIARLVQGKTFMEIARVLKESPKVVEDKLNSACRVLANRLYMKLCI